MDSVLRGESVTLRPMDESDIGRIAAIVTEPGTAEWWVDYDEATLRGELIDDPDVHPFVIGHGDETIGAVMYHEETDPRYRYAMIDVTVGARYVDRGLGTDALRTLIRWLFEERGHHRIAIDPAVANERAIAAYRRIGFQPVGVMRRYELGPEGEWRDALLMDLLAEEFDT